MEADFIVDLEAIIDRASDEQFASLLAAALVADPTGELHDRLQFHRQWRHNPEFRAAVAAEVRRINGVA